MKRKYCSQSLCLFLCVFLSLSVYLCAVWRLRTLISLLQQPSLSSRETLQQLHWLPVKWQIQFKLASLTYKVLHTGTPSYLSERLHPYVPSRTLRSSSSTNLYVPRTNLHFGSRSFHIAAPTVWNYLPSTFRSSQTLNTF